MKDIWKFFTIPCNSFLISLKLFQNEKLKNKNSESFIFLRWIMDEVTGCLVFANFFFFFFWLCCSACGILVPQPGVEPGPLAVKARSPNYWTAREFKMM